jgi:hypothetical protein
MDMDDVEKHRRQFIRMDDRNQSDFPAMYTTVGNVKEGHLQPMTEGSSMYIHVGQR